MAIAFDNATDGGFLGGVTSLTFSHTVGTGANRILFVQACTYSTAADITGITYAGVSMTAVGNASSKAVSDPDRFVYLYVLPNPASGANNVVISTSASVLIGGAASSYTGALQTSTVDQSTTARNVVGVTNFTTTLTSIANNCWTVIAVFNTDSSPMTAGAGTTIRVKDTPINSCIADSNAAITPAGSTSLIINSSGNVNWATVMASFAPSIASTISSNLTILGVG